MTKTTITLLFSGIILMTLSACDNRRTQEEVYRECMDLMKKEGTIDISSTASLARGVKYCSEKSIDICMQSGCKKEN